MNTKKIIIFCLFVSFVFSYQLSLAETYPATCDSTAQIIISGLGGCSAIGCPNPAYSNTCSKCCGQTTQTQTTTCIPTYSNWSACQANGTQTRTVVSKSPTGCTGGTFVTSQLCAQPISVSATSTPSTSL